MYCNLYFLELCKRIMCPQQVLSNKLSGKCTALQNSTCIRLTLKIIIQQNMFIISLVLFLIHYDEQRKQLTKDRHWSVASSWDQFLIMLCKYDEMYNYFKILYTEIVTLKIGYDVFADFIFMLANHKMCFVSQSWHEKSENISVASTFNINTDTFTCYF